MRIRPLHLTALCLLLASRAALAGGPIASGTTVAGVVAGPPYLESWTFNGTSGNRIILNAITTSGAFNTNIVLKAPGGAVETTTSGTDRLEWACAATGVYTIEVQDLGLNDTGNYAIAFVNVTAGPLTGGGDTDGGVIGSSDVSAGTHGVADIDAFTFTGTLGHRVLIDAITTGGVGHNTTIFLYPPGGGGYFTYTTSDRIDAALSASGTWTIVIEDNAADTPGNYSMSFLNVTAGPLTNGGDSDGGAIGSNEIKNATFQQGVDFDAFTFFAFAGNRVLITAVATSGGANTNLTLYPPNGAVSETATSADAIDWQVQQSGIYTVVLEDYLNDNAGDYTISVVNCSAGPLTTPADMNGGFMTSADVKTGTMSGIADVDVFQFVGNFGDRVLVDAVATAGAGFNTTIVLYYPNGGPYATYTTGDRLEHQLTATGTWSIAIYDNGYDTAGSYALSLLNVTSGPLVSLTDVNGGSITSNEIKTGQFQQGVDFDAFTFSGTAGQRVILTATATGGGLQNTALALYPPGGGTAETATTSDIIDTQLLVSGIYTLVVEEVNGDDTGPYTVSMVNLTAGPFATIGDLDGGPIVSAGVKSGTMSGVGDLDAYTFTGNAGDRVLIDAVATGGASFNTFIVLYPPLGGSYATYTTADRIDYQLTITGTWTILIEDNAIDHAGSYDLSVLNVTSGPHTSGTDTDGGSIASNEIKNAAFQQGVDFDAFTFTGTAGQRILVTGVATGGGTNNTNLSAYPPDGGPAETATSADQIDWQLSQTGTYTIVVEDAGNDHAGTYTLSMMNLSAGPFTSGGDLDGGAITSAAVKSGSMSGIGDVDAFTFTGNFGNRVIIDAVATGGASFNTLIVLYPPNGGSYATYTTGDRLEHQLTVTGTWTILVEDNANDTAGSYDLSFLNVTGGPLTDGADTDGGAILSNEIKTGQLNQGVDFDAFTFTGTAGQRVMAVAVATGGVVHNTNLTLYPPGGLVAETSTSSDKLDHQLQRTGTYTIVVEDVGNDNPGTYTLSYLNLAGALTNGSDSNGGPILSNQILTGTMSGIADMDAYTFQGTFGQRVVVSAVATAGASFNTTVVLYPPGGGSYFTYTTGDRLEAQLNVGGTWTVLIEDNAWDTAGSYSVSLLNITAGPYTGNGETDGGPILDNVTRSGSMISAADTDGYTFFGIAGQTANITATTTGGIMNTNIVLYPPAGATALTSTSTDNVTPVLQVNGMYTVVIEDVSNDETGTYNVNVNLSGGVTPVGDTPPLTLALHPGVPSPFSHTTRINYELPAADRVRLRVYDVRGALVRTLADEQRAAGSYGVTWDGRDDAGASVASGVYYLRMETRADVKKQKIVLVR